MGTSRKIIYGVVGTGLLALCVMVVKIAGPENLPFLGNNPQPGVAVAKPAPKLDKSANMQAQRKAFIEELKQNRIIADIDVKSGVAVVSVRDGFLVGDFKDKQRVVSAIYAYYFDGTRDADTVRLVDVRTNKQVGRYSIGAGGLKME